MSEPMLIHTLPVGPLQVNCHLLGCRQTRQAIVIDPGDEGERILQALAAAGLELALIVNTHGHFDHVGANRLLAERTGAPIAIHPADLPMLQRAGEHAAMFGLTATASPEPARLLKEEDVVAFGEMALEVLHTPGHSPGGICLQGQGHLFCGDTLFAGSIGRTDLPGGGEAQLIASIRDKLLVLPDETVVHPGHGPDTTIGREKRINPFL